MPARLPARAPYIARLLAAKVETYEVFFPCRSLGFALYQGTPHHVHVVASAEEAGRALAAPGWRARTVSLSLRFIER